MSKKIKISSDPNQLTNNKLQELAKKLSVDDWQTKDREDLLKSINQIAVYDKRKEKIDKILELTPFGFKSLGQIWFELYDKNKLWTSIISIIMLAAGIYSGVYLDSINSKDQQRKQLDNIEINKQIDNLVVVEKNLEDLIDFVQHQKITLSQTESKIESLIKEKNQMEPIVEANREIIQAIFEQQAINNKNNIYKERTIGFGLGIFGSILASIIFNFFRRKKIKPKE